MYELDNRKDHVMTICKVALANLAMWVRDRYFPASYAQATWKRLLPFFQLPGTITHSAQVVQVELHPFNDRALNRDLASCVNGSTRHRCICLMDTDSRSPSVQHVAFLLRRRRPKYRESLIMSTTFHF